MRTNIEIDDALLQQAMKATGQATKRATVEEALRTLVRLRKDVAWLRKFVRNDEATSSPTEHVMRTNIEVNDSLMRQALQAAGIPTKRGAVDEALRLVVRLHRQKQAIEALQGIGWEGDLDEMRRDWS
jgi:Arc/MetJ family transcription regulator